MKVILVFRESTLVFRGQGGTAARFVPAGQFYLCFDGERAVDIYPAWRWTVE